MLSFASTLALTCGLLFGFDGSRRLRRDSRGRFHIFCGSSFNFATAVNKEAELLDAFTSFSYPAAPESEPQQSLAEQFVEQLDVTKYLNGQSPLFGLRLTNVKNGCILGVSLSHALAGAQACQDDLFHQKAGY